MLQGCFEIAMSKDLMVTNKIHTPTYSAQHKDYNDAACGTMGASLLFLLLVL